MIGGGLVGGLLLNSIGANEEILGYKINDYNKLEGNYVYNALTSDDGTVIAGTTKKLDAEVAKKIASKVIDNANVGKIRYSSDAHGRLGNEMEMDILSNPDAVYFSQGKEQNLIFRKGGNVVIVKSGGSSKGNVLTRYGPAGARGKSGAAIYGGSPDDLGMPITEEAIIKGKVLTPKGGTLPPGTRIIP